MMLRRWAISVLSLHQWNTKSLKIKNEDLFLLSTLFNYPHGINERLFPAVSTSPLALISWKMGRAPDTPPILEGNLKPWGRQ